MLMATITPPPAPRRPQPLLPVDGNQRARGWVVQALAAVVGTAALLVAGCGGDDGDDAADAESTTTSEPTSGSTTTQAAKGGDVDAVFCAALSADLDAIDAIVNSFETSGAAPDRLVQEARDANDALQEATPDGAQADAKAIYEPLSELLRKLESGDTGNIATEYAAAVGTPAFTEPLSKLAQQCAAAGAAN